MFKLWPWLEANKNRLIGGAVAAVVVAGIVYLLAEQHARREVAAGEALTSLMVNPMLATNNAQLASSLEQMAVTYAGTAAAQRAQLEAGTTLFEAGSFADAQAQFQKLLDGHPTGPFAATAELGVAASFEAENKLDQAAATYQRVTAMFSGTPYAIQAEFGLGRIAEQQNKFSDASSHYENVMRSAVSGSLAQEAAIRDAELKLKMPAAAPKSAATPLLQPAMQPQPAAKPAAAPAAPAKP